MVRHSVQPVGVIEENNYSVIRHFIKFRKSPTDQLGGRISSLKVCQSRVKRRSCDSAIFPLCRNTALANFSKIFVLKRQLYGHWIKYFGCRDCRHADTTDPSRAYRTKTVPLTLCRTPLLMLFDYVILSKKFAELELSKNWG